LQEASLVEYSGLLMVAAAGLLSILPTRSGVFQPWHKILGLDLKILGMQVLENHWVLLQDTHQALYWEKECLNQLITGLHGQRIISTNPLDITTFSASSPWYFVHKLAVHPITGDVYAAVHRRILRSADGGNTWAEVFGSTTGATAEGGIADLAINKTGSRVLVAMSGRNADRSLAGIIYIPIWKCRIIHKNCRWHKRCCGLYPGMEGL